LRKCFHHFFLQTGGKFYPAVHAINWYRIVMDESHKSKGKTDTSCSLSSLVSKRRWCVTGTFLLIAPNATL
jgi:hypothetical protein